MKFTLHWLDGRKEVVEGETIAKAMTNAGYGHGAIRALDFYTNGADDSYEFVKEQHGWMEKKEG